MLTRETLKKLLSYNPCTGEFRWKEQNPPRRRIPVGRIAGWRKSDGYVQIGIEGETYYAHVLAWLYVYGEWPDEIDHLNEIKWHNSIFNLLNGTHSDNLSRYYRNRRWS
jgi:hypothetical protein